MEHIINEVVNVYNEVEFMFVNNLDVLMGQVIKELIDDFDEVFIVVGYIGSGALEMFNNKIKKFISQGGKMHLCIGRAGVEGLSRKSIEMCWEWRELGVNIYIADYPFHSKMYLGKKYIRGRKKDIKAAVVGSSNFSLHGLYSWNEANICLENNTPEDCDRIEEIENEIYEIIQESTLFDQIEVPIIEYKQSSKVDPSTRGGRSVEIEEDIDDFKDEITISFLRKGGVPEKSGLNWWNAAGRRRNPNEAYIPLRKKVLTQNPSFFPNRGTKGQKINVITDDGKNMLMRLEGSGAELKSGRRLAKQIASAEDKTIFGEWILREKLNLPPEVLVTREILEEYGRTNITFIKLNDNRYLMDFSV